MVEVAEAEASFLQRVLVQEATAAAVAAGHMLTLLVRAVLLDSPQVKLVG